MYIYICTHIAMLLYVKRVYHVASNPNPKYPFAC